MADEFSSGPAIVSLRGVGKTFPNGVAALQDATFEIREGEFVSLLGPDRAKAQSQALVDQAIAHLAQHGREADLLRALARYIVERKH